MCLKAGYNQKPTQRKHFQNLTFILFKVSAQAYAIYFPTRPKQFEKQSRYHFISTVSHNALDDSLVSVVTH